MPVVAYPSPGRPAPPALRLEVPDTWQSPPAGDALVRAVGPGSAGGEVVVEARHRVEAPGTSAEGLAADVAARAAGAAGEVEEVFLVEIADREWTAHNVSRDEADGPVVEVHLVTVVGADEAAVSAVHVLGRATGDDLDADYDLLQQVLETVTVGEVPAADEAHQADEAGA